MCERTVVDGKIAHPLTPGNKAALRARMARTERLIIGIEERAIARVIFGVVRHCALSTTVSKNQVVWARCHFVGLASAMDCTPWSSGERPCASKVLAAQSPAIGMAERAVAARRRMLFHRVGMHSGSPVYRLLKTDYKPPPPLHGRHFVPAFCAEDPDPEFVARTRLCSLYSTARLHMSAAATRSSHARAVGRAQRSARPKTSRRRLSSCRKEIPRRLPVASAGRQPAAPAPLANRRR